jgi:hypothetical protein
VDAAPTWLERLRWLALAAVPTSLLLGVTNYITTDITPMPLLWVIPLGLYLLTFIIAFGRAPSWFHKTIELIAPVSVLILLFTILGKKPESWVMNILLHMGTFFLVALNCHLGLARQRPAASRLTEFYLWVSAGGVLGGLFNALIAPLLFSAQGAPAMFTDLTEYPLALVFACLLQPPGDSTESGTGAWILDLIIPVIVGVMTVGLLQMQIKDTWLYNRVSDWVPRPTAEDPLPKAHFPIPGWGPWEVVTTTLVWYLIFGPPMLIAYFWVDRPLRFGLAIAAIWLAGTKYTYDRSLEWHDGERAVFRDRSFYGRLQVDELKEEESGPIYHKLIHGTTLHGKQQFDPLSPEPLTYYHKTGPIGQVFAEKLPAIDKGELAFIGLGTGTMAAYLEKGQKGTFYDIDSHVVAIASNPEYFTFLRDSKGEKEIVLGDARLKLEEHGKEGQYGLIVVDAFSSDAIPIHLLTKEAVALYRSRLAPGGIIALHISNRYLELAPVAAKIAESLGMAGLHEWDSDQSTPGKNSSEWIMLAKDPADFGGLRDRTYEGEDDNGNRATLPRWKKLEAKASDPLFTDDFSNMLLIMNHLPEWLSKIVKGN